VTKLSQQKKKQFSAHGNLKIFFEGGKMVDFFR